MTSRGGRALPPAADLPEQRAGVGGRFPFLLPPDSLRTMSTRATSSTSSPPTTSRPRRIAFGRAIAWGSGASSLLAVFALQTAQATGWIDLGLATWRPTLYAYLLWSVCLCWSQVLIRGEQGKRTLFVLPAVLFVVSLTVFPLLFGILIALSDWNLVLARRAAVQRRRQHRPDVARPVLLERARQHGLVLRSPSSSSTPSPSASRCCSTPRSGRASSGGWRSCCR